LEKERLNAEEGNTTLVEPGYVTKGKEKMRDRRGEDVPVAKGACAKGSLFGREQH